MRVLLTCPPMIQMLSRFETELIARGLEVDAPEFIQTLPESELVKRVPDYDGWIIGDDPVTRAVLEAGRNGRLKAAVKWGVGTDTIDFDAARELGVPITNTPGAFGCEVADVALGYLIVLARRLMAIDRGVSAGGWPKPPGISLAGKTAAIVGLGDVGLHLARRLRALEMRIISYDPQREPPDDLPEVESARWPERIDEADAIVFVCALTRDNRHMLNTAVLERVKEGVRIVNVARGALIDEAALVSALKSGRVDSAALDVFEQEPLPDLAPLRGFADRVIFGSHNSSNTVEAVVRASSCAIDRLCELLRI